MSILEKMRSGSDSTFMQVMMAAVVISFIGWYAVPDGDRSNVVAVVNGQKILDTEFSRRYSSAQRSMEAMTGRMLSNEEQKELSERVRMNLVEDEVLLQEARRIGLEVSDLEVARELLQLPVLRNEQGRFDEEIYRLFLRRNQWTRADFEESLREDLLRNKLRSLVFMGASISEPALREAWVDSETRVDITYVRVRPSAFAQTMEITAEERDAWLAENSAMVQETYQRDFERLYNHPEQVRLRMIRLAATTEQAADILPRMNQLRAQLEGGADFAEFARQWSEDPTAADGGDLGTRPLRQLATDVRTAIESLQPGQLSRVVTTDRDMRLYLLEERIEPRQDALEDVRDQIADQLIRAERGPVLAAAFAEERLLPAWREAGEVPRELVETNGLSVMTTGPVPAVADGSPFSPPPELMRDARNAKVGDVLPQVYETDGILWIGQLTDRTEADMEMYAQRRDEIREAVLSQRRMAFFQGWVDDLESRARIEIGGRIVQ